MSEKTYSISRHSSSFRYALAVLPVLVGLFFTLGFAKHNDSSPTGTSESAKVWVGTWSTAPQLVEPHNLPPEPGLSNNTLRQVVCVSIGGDTLRLKFSNEFSTSPVTMQAVQIAVSKGGGVIDANTIKEVKFNQQSAITMNPGSAVSSDPIAFALKPRMQLAITIYFGQTSPDVTGHPGSRTTSYLLAGNQISSVDFKGSVRTDHWYTINGIDVKTSSSAAAVAILGNSITDGRGSGTNLQNRWPDILAERLLKNPATRQVGVLNLGIGGNCVLRECLGPAAIERFERDVLGQQRVRWLIIFEGVNDIGQAPDSKTADQIADNLITALEQIIDQAHAAGLLVYGATITPIGKSFYYADYREEARRKVNEWIRTSGCFDAVIDFDKAMRNPAEPSTIMDGLHDGDYLHPSQTGHQIMGKAVDLNLFKIEK